MSKIYKVMLYMIPMVYMNKMYFIPTINKVHLYMIPMFIGIIYSITVILKRIVRGIKSGRAV